MTDESTSPLAALYRKHHDEGDRRGSTVLQQQRGNVLRNWIGTGKHVLDLGCRDGTFTRVFQEGNRVVGADIDDVALRACAGSLGIPVLQANLNGWLPFCTDCFDVVVAAEVLEHLPYLPITLGEVRRVLKPGGVFVGSVPLDLSLRGRWRIFRGKRICHDSTHLQHWSQRTFEQDMSAYFRIEEIAVLRGSTRFAPLRKTIARQIAFRLGKT